MSLKEHKATVFQPPKSGRVAIPTNDDSGDDDQADEGQQRRMNTRQFVQQDVMPSKVPDPTNFTIKWHNADNAAKAANIVATEPFPARSLKRRRTATGIEALQSPYQPLAKDDYSSFMRRMIEMHMKSLESGVEYYDAQFEETLQLLQQKEDELQSTREELLIAEGDVGKLKTQIEVQHEELLAARSDMTLAKEKCESFSTELENSRSSLQSANHVCKVMQEQITELEAAFNASRADRERIERQFEAAQHDSDSRIRGLESELTAVKADREKKTTDCEAQLQVRKSQVEQLQEEAQAAQQKTAAFQDEICTKNSLITRLEIELPSLESTAKAQSLEIQDLNNQVHDKTQALKSLTEDHANEVKELEAQHLIATKREVESHANEIKKRKAQLEEALTKLRAKSTREDDYLQKRRQLDNNLSILYGQMGTIESNIEAVSTTNKEERSCREELMANVQRLPEVGFQKLAEVHRELVSNVENMAKLQENNKHTVSEVPRSNWKHPPQDFS